MLILLRGEENHPGLFLFDLLALGWFSDVLLQLFPEGSCSGVSQTHLF